ncbi:hypothetical protein [Runella rosea]|nr:hypothetical protein [Runella rosea]
MDRLKQFEDMWNTDKNNYVLELSTTSSCGYFIYRIDPFGFVIIEDDEILTILINKMIDEGVKIVRNIDEVEVVHHKMTREEFYKWVKKEK